MPIWKMMIHIMTSYHKPVANLVNRSVETEQTKMMFEVIEIKSTAILSALAVDHVADYLILI